MTPRKIYVSTVELKALALVFYGGCADAEA